MCDKATLIKVLCALGLSWPEMFRMVCVIILVPYLRNSLYLPYYHIALVFFGMFSSATLYGLFFSGPLSDFGIHHRRSIFAVIFLLLAFMFGSCAALATMHRWFDNIEAKESKNQVMGLATLFCSLIEFSMDFCFNFFQDPFSKQFKENVKKSPYGPFIPRFLSPCFGYAMAGALFWVWMYFSTDTAIMFGLAGAGVLLLIFLGLLVFCLASNGEVVTQEKFKPIGRSPDSSADGCNTAFCRHFMNRIGKWKDFGKSSGAETFFSLLFLLVFSMSIGSFIHFATDWYVFQTSISRFTHAQFFELNNDRTPYFLIIGVIAVQISICIMLLVINIMCGKKKHAIIWLMSVLVMGCGVASLLLVEFMSDILVWLQVSFCLFGLACLPKLLHLNLISYLLKEDVVGFVSDSLYESYGDFFLFIDRIAPLFGAIVSSIILGSSFDYTPLFEIIMSLAILAWVLLLTFPLVRLLVRLCRKVTKSPSKKKRRKLNTSQQDLHFQRPRNLEPFFRGNQFNYESHTHHFITFSTRLPSMSV